MHLSHRPPLCIVHCAFCIALALAALGVAKAAAPATYLDYIESNGTSQYIDLGIEGRCNLEVEAVLAYVRLPNDASFIASRNGNTRFYPLHYWDGVFQLGYGNNTATSVRAMRDVKYTLNAKFTQGEQTMTVDGTVVARGTSSTAVSTGRTMYLFACNYGGSPNYYTQGRLYSLKIWNLVDGERGNLLGDFRPCLDGDGVPCLYDAVTEDYFHNAGSGTFAYGELPAANLPTVHHYVEYLESDGTQFINTGIPAQLGLKTNVRFSFTTVPNDGGILCAVGNGYRIYGAYYYVPNKGFFYATGSGANIPSSEHLATAGTIYTVAADLFRNYRNFYLNGEEIGPVYTADYNLDTLLPFYLFCRNNGGTPDYFSSMRLYECQIWGSVHTRQRTDDPALLLDLHPCVDTDGVAGLYDSVSGRILYKGRGNAFATGPALSTAARVIAASGALFEGTASPDYGSDDTLAEGDVETYTCDRYHVDDAGLVYECVGYTTATSEDGSIWSAESALVESRSATLAYPGGWWRLTWQWRHVGYQIKTELPAGASVAASSPPLGGVADCYAIDQAVSFTASATDGGGNTFAGWAGDLATSVFDTNRTTTVTAATRAKTLVAHYRHAWTLLSEVNGVKTITDGLWTNEVVDGVVGAMAGVGKLDFTTVENDLGFKITSFKSWMPNTSHLGPQLITEVIAPDAETVEALTFDDCRYLERAVLSPSLHHIGRSAFYRCTSLREISPSLSQYLSQARNTTAADMYVFRYCGNLTEDVVVERSKGDGTLVLPDAVFEESGIRAVDFSRCRGNVDLTSTASYSTFRRCANLGYMKLNPDIESIPRGMCWGLAALTNLYITGALPAPENIGGFYAYDYYRLKVYISKALNPTVVADLQLRAPTEAEMAKATFPRAEYEAGKFLGVWDQPTSGWGALEADGKFRQMWVVDWNPPTAGATVIMVQ